MMSDFEVFDALGSALVFTAAKIYISGQGGIINYAVLGTAAAIGAIPLIQGVIPSGFRTFLADNLADWDESAILQAVIGAFGYNIAVSRGLGADDLSLRGAGLFLVGAMSAIAGVRLGKWIKGKVSPAEAASSKPTPAE